MLLMTDENNSTLMRFIRMIILQVCTMTSFAEVKEMNGWNSLQIRIWLGQS